MDQYQPGIYTLTRPADVSGPVVYNSPHSGNIYPGDFGYSCPLPLLARAEDTGVDQLFADAPAQGAPLLKALFPRTYIDVNRALDDIDPAMLAEKWPDEIARNGRSAAGHGLIRKLVRPGQSVYDRKLSLSEVRHRIDTYYLPYHAALKNLLDETWNNFGQVWHIDCHSMPSTSAYVTNGTLFRPSTGTQVDIVLGTRDGTTCSPYFVKELKYFLERLGYRVSINNPYKGVDILRRYGDPLRNRHSLQIELSKALYLDEETNELTSAATDLKNNLSKMMGFIRDYAHQSGIPAAAD